jgi:hypothetical protein
MPETVTSCEVCAEEALRYGGNIKAVKVFGIRHWKPVKIWSNGPVGTKKVLNDNPVWFCRGPERIAREFAMPRAHQGTKGPHSQE